MMSENNEIFVEQYCEKEAQEWDSFVLNNSVNGNFLQTRRFLNYHPENRFKDASYIVRDSKKHIIAVCPGCEVNTENEKIIYSHMGSTYGGIIINKKWYRVEKVIDIIKALEDEWIRVGYQKVILKQSPGLLSSEKIDLVRYCFYYLKFQCHEQLNLYVDLEHYNEDILSEFSQGKRTNIHNCQKQGLYYRKLDTFEEIKQMHCLLEKSLEKYGIKPIHTPDELWRFQTELLRGECECFGAYDGEKMLSASMIFYFDRYNTAHTQYLCADPEYNKLSPMTYMYYVTLLEMRKRGYSKVSWGVCTEDGGRYLNSGLAKSKENFGSKYDINPIFVKIYK